MSCRRSFLLSLPMLAGLVSVHAQTQAPLQLRSNVSFLADDNFFRGASGVAVSERVLSQSIGIGLTAPYSLQRFSLDANLTGNQHQNFSNFDYIGQNYNAAWLWSVASKLNGSLTSTRAETLNSAGDVVNPALRNKNTTQNTALSAIYDLGGAWHLTTGLSNSNIVNERPLVGSTDNRSTAINAGVRYALGSGSSLAYSLQSASGNNVNDYNSITHDFNMAWVPTGNTSVSARVAYLQQRFGLVPQYDFSGIAGMARLNWRLSGKTSVTTAWQRDLASYQTSNTTHTQTDTFTLAPVWQISGKSSLNLQYRLAIRDELGSLSGGVGARQDRLQDVSLSYRWQPRPSATLSATLTELSRSSNATNADFVAHQLAVAAQFAF